jgi:hypothetical protein
MAWKEITLPEAYNINDQFSYFAVFKNDLSHIV